MGVPVLAVDLGAGVGAWFTARDRDAPEPAVGFAGNLSHHRPHRPTDLAATREEVARRIGQPFERWHLLRQVHGARVAIVDSPTPPGTELRDVDAAVTHLRDRPLVVQVADCVPVLLASSGAQVVGVAHAGRRGLVAGVIPAVVAAMRRRAEGGGIRAVVGPAIGGCCYEVPADMQRDVAARWPGTRATTTWGTPSLDLAAGVLAELAELGVTVERGERACTRCDLRWFSHRRDPTTGRFVGIVVAAR